MHLDHMDYNIGNIDNFKHLYRSILNKLTLSCSSSSLEKTSNRTKSEFAIPSLSSVHLITSICAKKSLLFVKSQANFTKWELVHSIHHTWWQYSAHSSTASQVSSAHSHGKRISKQAYKCAVGGLLGAGMSKNHMKNSNQRSEVS